MQRSRLIGTNIFIENKLKQNIAADVRLQGRDLVVTITQPNDTQPEIRRETSILVPSVDITKWGATNG